MRHFTATFLQLAVVAALLSPTPSHAILGFLKKDKDKNATSTAVLDEQENAAMALYEKALAKEKSGKYDSSRGLLEDIVKKYPLTSVAAQSQFKIGELYELDEKPSKAFDAYQTFIDRYKGSALFTVAVKRQFDIATRGYKGKTNSFLGLNYRLQPSRVVEMFTAITENAPYSEYAPLAQYSIGEIYASIDDEAKSIAAYQKVVSDYPDDPKAAEAQYQIGQLLTADSASGNNDQAHLRKTREAYEEFLIQFPENELAIEAQEQLSEIEALEVEKSFQIGEFYEKKGNLKAAAIYYREVLKHPSSEQFTEARTRLEAIGPKGAIQTESGEIGGEYASVKAPYDVKNRKDYLGPPAPVLVKVDRKRSMRTSMDDLTPMQIPVVEPDLPEVSAAGEESAATAVQPLLPPPNIGRSLDPTGAKVLPLPPMPETGFKTESGEQAVPEIKIIKSPDEEVIESVDEKVIESVDEE